MRILHHAPYPPAPPPPLAPRPASSQTVGMESGSEGERKYAELCIAADNDDVRAIRRLVAEGVNVNASGDHGSWTALLHAASKGFTDAAMALVDAGADINWASAAGNSALLLAAQWSYPDTVDALVDAGADVNHADRHGTSPLHHACRHGQLQTVRKLLDAGANMHACDTHWKTPAQVVRTGGGGEEGAASRLPHPPPSRAQVVSSPHTEASAPAEIHAALAAASPWRRRRAVAVGCYADMWYE
jgi:uncharacterized protein